jgi:glycosyltransferase involved in cell wall biosynthesis
LLRGAVALVSPSALESFGIVLTESWSVGRPVLVNRRCAVTAHHACEARGGLAFGDFADFEIAVARLVNTPVLADSLGSAGRRHTEQHFGWDAVVRRYRRLVEVVGH